jgi:hypothetical protein
MDKEKKLYLSSDEFFLNIFKLQLIESEDEEPMDIKS